MISDPTSSPHPSSESPGSGSLLTLQSDLGYEFQERQLLVRALTHRSFAREHNERLEFLGDSVLSCSVAGLLCADPGRHSEGTLSRVRATLVGEGVLAELARQLNLTAYLRLGAGEIQIDGGSRASTLADALEAVFGAIHLDGGFTAAESVIRRLYEPLIRGINWATFGKDPKTHLQEILQGRGVGLPAYSVVGLQGVEHRQTFEVECRVDSYGLSARGTGTSRQQAEKEAAGQMINALLSLPEGKPRSRRASRKRAAGAPTPEPTSEKS